MTVTDPDLNFDLEIVPFSRRGSFLAFSLYAHANQQQVYQASGAQVHEAVYLRAVHGGAGRSTLLKISLLHDGQPIPCRVRASAGRLRIEAPDQADRYAEFCLDEETVWLRTADVGLRCVAFTDDSPFETAFSPDGVRVTVNCYLAGIKLDFVPSTGVVVLDTTWLGSRAEHITVDLLPAPNSATAEHRIEGYTSTAKPDQAAGANFDSVSAAAAADYRMWLNTTLTTPTRYADTRALAAYICWSCVVRPRGLLLRPAMFMSKNWMARIWNWDNCFNALALAEQNPQMAWDQLLIFFDHQADDGALPDHVIDSSRSYRFYKPPVHGWTIRRLMQRTHWIDEERLRAIYDPLCRWTTWWLTFRDDDHDGIPQYNHGNESGWDNGTIFADGVPVESPDLAAYLIIQMDVLAEIAARLGRPDDQARWAERADGLLALLIAHFWDGEQFRARRNRTHEIPAGDALINYMPLLLGKRLPTTVRTVLIAGVERFLTPFGVATEIPASPLYSPDGYWRGPIWAPSTLLIVDGLLSCGADELAHTIMRRFCDLVAHSGMAENFDALTGAGLRDRAYTWTASVFLLLAQQLEAETHAP